jgi:curli biogenesis system outer membrane secretion channel CsgG
MAIPFGNTRFCTTGFFRFSVNGLHVCLLCSLLCGLVADSYGQQKRRVAVLNFDYGTVQSSVASVFGGNVDVGKGVSDLLVQKLVQDGKCSVIERSALDKVLNEQSLSNSDRADSSTAVKIGRVLGVDAVIVGTITQFGRDDKNTTLGAGGKVGDFTNKFGLGGLQKQHAKAVVGITARLIDTSTSEILAAVTGSGESTRAGTSLIGGGGGNVGGNGTYDMSSRNFADTMLGEAVHKAVDSLGAQLEEQVASIGAHKSEVSGLVADASDDGTLILNLGSNVGLHVGSTLDVSRQTRTVKDPTTGQVIKTVSSKIGTATVTEVDERSATATYHGSGSAKVGDTVKLASTSPVASEQQALTNDDVLTMFKGGLGESTVIKAIESQDTNFDISAKGLLQLKKAGIPPKVMDAMVAAAGKQKAADEAQQAAKAQAEATPKTKEGAVVPASLISPMAPAQPSVLMVLGAVKQAMVAGHTQIVQTKAKPTALSALASDPSLAQSVPAATPSGAGMGMGGSKLANAAMMANPVTAPMMVAGSLFSHRKQTVTDVWLIVGSKSETVIHNQPSFEVHCESVPGINVDEYEPVLLRLESTQTNFRLVGATEAKLDALQAPTPDWGLYSAFMEERVPGQATKIGPGVYQLQASSTLPPGEYGVVLRPINKDKKFSGVSVSQNLGDGLLFNSLWSFEIAQ